MAFYAYLLGNEYKVNPILVSITNRNWWSKVVLNKRSPKSICDDFNKDIDSTKLKAINIFWQDIKDNINSLHDLRLEKLKKYLDNHICLT